jgi:mono/diheme cytochrome c family protein
MQRAMFFGVACALILGATVLRPTQAAEGDPVKGQQVYALFCVTCHGESGDGKGPVGLTLDPPPRDFTVGEWKFGGTDQDIFDVISNGAAAKGGSPLMAPWGAVIAESDRWALVADVRTLRKE